MKGLGLGQQPGKLQVVWGCLALPGSGAGNARSGNVGCDPLGLQQELIVGLWISGVFMLMVLCRSRSINVRPQRVAHYRCVCQQHHAERAEV